MAKLLSFKNRGFCDDPLTDLIHLLINYVNVSTSTPQALASA